MNILITIFNVQFNKYGKNWFSYLVCLRIQDILKGTFLMKRILGSTFFINLTKFYRNNGVRDRLKLIKSKNRNSFESLKTLSHMFYCIFQNMPRVEVCFFDASSDIIGNIVGRFIEIIVQFLHVQGIRAFDAKDTVGLIGSRKPLNSALNFMLSKIFGNLCV